LPTANAANVMDMGMLTDTFRFTAIMLLAGFGIPVLAALNAQLGARIGSPPAAATVLFAVALLAALAAALLTAGLAPIQKVPDQPSYLLAGGLFVAYYVLSVTWVAPRFGVGNAVFCVLLGQLISAATIDHFGLFGAVVRELSLLRAGGSAFMTAGLLMVLRA
jgi:transporter family-2 protein